MERIPEVEGVVIYHDSKGGAHKALVTTVWTPTAQSLLNIVFVSGDESRQDGCGRQIERATSVQHKSSGIHGNYWRWLEEEPNAYVAPAQS